MSEDKKQAAPQITEEQLSKLISYLRPDHELYSGRKFFTILLEYKGMDGVLEFIKKASHALSEKGELDLYFDFDDVEKEAFKKARINYMSRRGFFGVAAVGTAGAVFTATGVSGLLRQLSEINQTKEEDSSAPALDRAEHFIQKELYPTAEVLIGTALVNEGYDKRLEIKLEQIADAVTELDLKIQKEVAKQSAQAASR